MWNICLLEFELNNVNKYMQCESSVTKPQETPLASEITINWETKLYHIGFKFDLTALINIAIKIYKL